MIDTTKEIPSNDEYYCCRKHNKIQYYKIHLTHNNVDDGRTCFSKKLFGRVTLSVSDDLLVGYKIVL